MKEEKEITRKTSLNFKASSREKLHLLKRQYEEKRNNGQFISNTHSIEILTDEEYKRIDPYVGFSKQTIN